MRIILVDDDQSFLRAMTHVLSQDHQVTPCHNLDMVTAILKNESYDLLIADYDFGPLNLVDYLKSHPIKIPIFVTSGAVDKAVAINLLNIGVDALFEKPLSIAELKDKINLLSPHPSIISEKLLKVLDINFKENSRFLEVKDEEIRLTPIEYNILLIFLKNPNKELSRETLEKMIWPDSVVCKHTINTHLTNLKHKIPKLRDHLISIYSSGYMLKVENNINSGLIL